MELKKWQQDFLNADKSVRIAIWPRRSGKTVTMAEYVVANADDHHTTIVLSAPHMVNHVCDEIKRVALSRSKDVEVLAKAKGFPVATMVLGSTTRIEVIDLGRANPDMIPLASRHIVIDDVDVAVKFMAPTTTAMVKTSVSLGARVALFATYDRKGFFQQAIFAVLGVDWFVNAYLSYAKNVRALEKDGEKK